MAMMNRIGEGLVSKRRVVRAGHATGAGRELLAVFIGLQRGGQGQSPGALAVATESVPPRTHTVHFSEGTDGQKVSFP